MDSTLVAAHILIALQSLISRETDPTESAVITIGTMQAGVGAANVIPETATLFGTVRTLNLDVRAHIQKRVPEVASHIAQAILLLLAVGVIAAFAKYKDRLVDLIKKQFTDQMQKQVAARPRPTPAQAKAQFRTMQQTMRDQAANARPPSNSSERRQAQKRKP